MRWKWNRRRRLVIDGFQYRLLAFNLAYVFAVLVVFAGTLFIPLILTLEDSAASLAKQEVVANQFLTLHLWFWPSMLVVFGLMAFHSIIISNRIAGALYRFRRVFEAVSNGDLTVRAKIRKNDYLLKEADDINAMIAALGARLREADDQQGKTYAKLQELKKVVDGGMPGEIIQAVKDLEEQAGRLRAKMDTFQLPGPA